MGIDLLGKHVRCPHCKQVVLAPPPAEPVAVAVAVPTPVTPPPPHVAPAPPVIDELFAFESSLRSQPPIPPVPTPLPPSVPVPEPASPLEPVFNIPNKERADSIFSEENESEDDVFGNANPKPISFRPVSDLPTEPLPVEFPESPPLQFDEPLELDMLSEPPVNPTAHVLPVPEDDPDLDDPPIAYPTVSSAPPAPHVNPQPLPSAVPQLPQYTPVQRPAESNPHATGNPWAGMAPVVVPQGAPPGAMGPASPNVAVAYPAPVVARPVAVQPPMMVPTVVATVEEVSQEKPVRINRGRRNEPSSGGIPKGVLFGLAAYALLMTALAVYGLAFKSGALPPEHPLSTIPDTFGEFEPATRKKVSLYRFKTDLPLPAELHAGLGGKITVGQLEVEPQSIVIRRVNLHIEGKGEPSRTMNSPGDALVLQFKVTNTSPDLSFHPVDPAFNRKTITEDRPLTRVVVADNVFYGGPINWPFRKETRVFDKEQENDTTPLKPGESREYFLPSAADLKLLRLVRNSTEPMQWRIQLRSGMIERDGREIPVTSVIGVDFDRGEVKEGKGT